MEVPPGVEGTEGTIGSRLSLEPNANMSFTVFFSVAWFSTGLGPFQSEEAERCSGFPGGGHQAAGAEDSVGVKEHCERKDKRELVKQAEGGVGSACPRWRDGDG